MDLFMTSICIFGNPGIFCEFSADWAIGWLMGGFFYFDPALPCCTLGFICEVSFIKDFVTCFSGCILGFKPLLTQWTSGRCILLDFAWECVCTRHLAEFPILLYLP